MNTKKSENRNRTNELDIFLNQTLWQLMDL